MVEGLLQVERLLGHMEQRQTEQHFRNGVKELLLASRSVIDSVIDTLDEKESTTTARKITISKD
ncbi:hypothetical protein I6N90_17605 [Paenibacillus sp. GSMTC-2017]|nr:hypothetical protein [Paenibacillus sp. GSMTC-2017]